MPFKKDKRKLVSNILKLEQRSHKNGFRKSIYIKPNDKYVGDWKNSAKEGCGSQLISDSLYEGAWKKDLKHGHGVSSWEDDDKIFHLEYRGNWKDGFQHGYGAKHYRDGSYYLGYLKKSKRHGSGQMWYVDGSYYEGDWSKDKHSGLGMFVRVDGNRYEGEWNNNLKHGRGRFFHLGTGQMQEGVWEYDICVVSVLVDIPFRQTAVCPTQYPLQVIELSEPNEVCSLCSC
ncbi:hypothetical protein RN001_011572 [Aquatica leii]|uniref:MORN repeat-containing protein 3 n=1 Tax=Aquatica leii TaxID=1421715 RepID=A0AAN7Q0V5_9COLE|nr:hypothetical protein RN001_011572 [Aquatica leii]